MLLSNFMSLLPFILIGLLNGLVVGCAVAFIVRAFNADDSSMRFRDASALGMIGSLGGSGVATAINSESGYLMGGSSSLVFTFVGAMLALAIANVFRRRSAGHLSRS